MPVVKNKSSLVRFAQTSTILYSLFIVSSISFSLHAQDTNTQDHEELMLVFDNDSDNLEEIYPLEDIDTACFTPEIQAEDQTETPKADQSEMSEADSIEQQDPIIEWDQNYIDDLELDPTAKLYGIEMEPVVVDEDVDFLNSIVDAKEEEDYPFIMISQDQLEDILDNRNEQFEDDISAKIIMPDQLVANAQAATIVIDTEDDDDIIPVPHDLINSVKKANKQKKKLEKLARKERADSFKKSKKKNKQK